MKEGEKESEGGRESLECDGGKERAFIRVGQSLFCSVALRSFALFKKSAKERFALLLF